MVVAAAAAAAAEEEEEATHAPFFQSVLRVTLTLTAALANAKDRRAAKLVNK